MKLSRPKSDAEIPTSSMADIAFLLIVYFMLTTTFAATRGLDFSLPKDDDRPPEIEPEESVLIEILPSGQLMVDQKPMELGDAILEYLAPKLEANPKKPVIIKPDPQAPYGYMVQVFDVLRQGKILGEGPNRELVWLKKHKDVSQETWEQGKDINVSIPTRREIDSFWH
ncbi:MAG: biopolymer transporter ExbD [Acidobacteria bacterium]|nr:MAG: biopolymer transporter ExbD [Acidobacteriota bacterium]